jgi:superkiller protein 3
LGRYPEAIVCYDHAVQLKPDYYQAWSNRGSAYAKWYRYEDAIASYNVALKLKPEDAGIWYNKACCYASGGHVEQAMETLQKALALNPEEYKQLAKTDPDFDAIREREIFKQLVDV